MDLLFLFTVFLGGLVAGILGGLLGIGGGIVLMPILRFLVGLSPSHAAGTCVLVVFFTTLGGSYRHHKLGHVDWRSITPTIVSGALATTLFSFVFLYLSTRDRWLDLLMGAVFLIISARMIVEGLAGYVKGHDHKRSVRELKGTLLQKASIGFVAGVLPGLLGIGTGAVLVPAFTYVLNAPMKVAIGSSLTCFSANALISSVFKFWQGFADLNLALPMCVGALIGANLGAVLNKQVPSPALKFLFGIVFSYVAGKFVLSFVEVGI